MKKYLSLLLVLMAMVFAIPASAETVAPTADAATTAASQYTPEEMLDQWYQLGTLLRSSGNYPFVKLSKGDSGFEVRALQTRLAELGYYTKEVVDDFKNGTYKALRTFEKANDLKVDGVASAADQKVLFGSDAIAYTATKTSSSSGKGSKSDSGGNSGSDATSSATGN